MGQIIVCILLFLSSAIFGSSALTCVSCIGKSSSQCNETVKCRSFDDPDSSEVCVNDVRVTNGEILIRKQCMQRLACLMQQTSADNNCGKFGGKNAKCLCCCDADNCNAPSIGCIYPNECIRPDSPAHGFTVCPRRFNVGGQCFFRCQPGFTLVGPNSTTCTRDAETAQLAYNPPEVPTCEKVVIRCKSPHKTPRNGKMNCTNLKFYKKAAKYNFEGSKCRFTCDKNYEVVGKLQSTCRGNGKWSAKTPRCIRRKCKPIKTNPNLLYICSEEFLTGSTCKFQCRSGYKLSGYSSITCLQGPNRNTPSRWSGPLPVCRRISCQTQQPPTHGNVRCSNRNYLNSYCVFTCDFGYVVGNVNITSNTIICQDDGDEHDVGKWSGEAPKCTSFACQPELSNPKYGNVKCSDKNRLGSVCNYTCYDGYDIDATNETSFQTTCKEVEGSFGVMVWSHPPPVCTAMTCKPAHKKPENGTMTCSNENRLGSLCLFACDRIFDLDRTEDLFRTSECVDDGNGDSEGVWKGAAGRCTIIKCKPPHTDPGNGTVSCSNENILESECKFKCNDGYEIVGKPISTCEDKKRDGNAIAEWSSEAPVCARAQCKLPKIDNANVKRDCGLEKGEKKIEVGTVCTYKCAKKGHFMTPRDNQEEVIKKAQVDSVCQADKHWSADPPMCHPVLCLPIPIAPDNGFMPSCTDSIMYNSTCKFQCEAKYKASHEQDMVCESDGDSDIYGKWSTAAPTCEKNECEDFGQVRYGNIRFTNGNKIGSVGSLTCNEGYSHKDPSNANTKCLPAGAGRKSPGWSGGKNVCCVRCASYNSIKVIAVIDKTAAQSGKERAQITDFIINLLKFLNSNAYEIKFGLVSYDVRVSVGESFSAKELQGSQGIAKLKKTISHLTHGGVSSNTGEALKYVHKDMFRQEAADIPFIILIMGTNSGDPTKEAAELLRNQDISILVVEFGTESSSIVNYKDRLEIVGEKENILSMKEFWQLKIVTDRISTVLEERGCRQARKWRSCQK